MIKNKSDDKAILIVYDEQQETKKIDPAETIDSDKVIKFMMDQERELVESRVQLVK